VTNSSGKRFEHFPSGLAARPLRQSAADRIGRWRFTSEQVPDSASPWWLVTRVLRKTAGQGAVKWCFAREQIPKRAAEGVDVRPCVPVALLDFLRTPGRRGVERSRRRCDVRVVGEEHRTSETKIDELHERPLAFFRTGH